MAVGCVYHALFAYTGWITRALREQTQADGYSPVPSPATHAILRLLKAGGCVRDFW